MSHPSSSTGFSAMEGAMKKTILRITLLLLLGSAAFAQKLLIEADTQEGQMLQQIDAEQNEAKKQGLLEQFSKAFPNHEAMTWVLGQIQSYQVTQKNWDRV